jgi:hypothetical protein
MVQGMNRFVSYRLQQIRTLGRRFSAFVNPPLPGDPGSMPRLRDYPIAKPR